MNYKYILNELLGNIFIPAIELKTKLPDSPGAYVICAKSTDILPASMRKLEYSYNNGLPVIYVGIAGRPTSRVKSLRKRDYETHFNGTARRSTLRKSLGVLFGFEKQYESEKSNSKYKFIPEHEMKLSKWMQDNLVIHFFTIDNPMELELYLIKYYEPPLNLKDNHSEKNKIFREELSHLRTLR